jgi:hypothetical protein
MKSFLGINWRTTLTGLVETLIGAVMAVSVLPPETWLDKRKLALALLLIVLKTVRDALTKDAAVILDGKTRRPIK